jgi:hypothetical protein
MYFSRPTYTFKPVRSTHKRTDSLSFLGTGFHRKWHSTGFMLDGICWLYFT